MCRRFLLPRLAAWGMIRERNKTRFWYMKVIVVGAGEVGVNIARHLMEENQDVVVVENDPEKVRLVSEQMDVQVVEGHGAHPDVLQTAGGDQADMLIAVTRSDEVNMVACQIAHSLFNIPTKIARVRDSSYLNVTKQRLYSRNNMPVDVVISPELEVASAILRTLAVPGAFDAEDFADGRARVVGVRIVNDAPVLAATSLAELMEGRSERLRILGVFRQDRLLIPGADDHLEKGDDVYFICHRDDSAACMQLMGYEEQLPHNVFVLGGGTVGVNICRRLERQGLHPRVLELSKTRAEELADELIGTTVLHGDALDRDILRQENIEKMDAVVCVTQDDAVNLLASVLVRGMNPDVNIITLINKSTFVPLVKGMGLERVISPGEITASRIMRHMRRCHVHSLHSVYDGEAEVMEARVTANSPLVGLHVRDLHLPEGIALGAIVTEEKLIFPTGGDIVHEGDRLVLFCHVDRVHQAETLF